MKLFQPLWRVVAPALILAAIASPAAAQTTKVKFTLDWRYEAPAAAFLVALGKGYFEQEKLDVTIDSGSGSGMTITRVTSGAYEMGFADLGAVMEFVGNNPGAMQKPVSVMMIYNNTPSGIFALRKSGIKTPADLKGKTLGGPVFDAARRAFPVFAKANSIDLATTKWSAMDPAMRELMLVKGEVDAISGFVFYTPLALYARGVKPEDLVVLPYAQYGVKLYGNSVIANDEWARKNPAVVKAMLRAIAKGFRDTIANPVEAITYVKKRDPLIDDKLELARLKLLISQTLNSPDARAEGFGQVSQPRVTLMATQVSDAFNTKARIDASTIFDASYLPSRQELDILPKAAK